MKIDISEFDYKELEMCAKKYGTDMGVLISSCLYYLPEVIKKGWDDDLTISYRIQYKALLIKYKALVHTILDAARISSRGELYTVEDERIYTVLKAVEHEMYEEKVKELER